MNKKDLKKQIIHWISTNYDHEEEILLADGFEEAFIGLGHQFDTPCAVYDVDQCINSLVDEGMTHEEAWEYFDFNVQGSYVGKNTPIFIERFRS